eukprot:CAMPEP_0184484030 /NCGR_PEP_ID=MMETSP0113_2-20130426/5720_1 /TAXON_ID=91329 /ORGANISM="Norrisiella sphaerica, Strain BC52" /LENGTH=601 /DNA_ID=CAMNT_0026864781 /DNA_START=486 /DNA_END=2291 /DNA_ORIENTATION=-
MVAITSWVMGNVAPKFGLPKITAYIGTGIIGGSYCLGIIPESEIRNLDVIDKVSLAYIAFAAGSKPIVGGRSIATVTLCLILFTFSMVTLVMVLISPNLEFTKDLTASQQGGVAILVGTLACARSPSSAIAIIDDLRAAGPFTILTMAVTCVMDVLVIFMFAVNNLIASSQFDNGGDSSVIFGKSIARLILSSLLGAFMGKFIFPYALWWWPSRIEQCKHTAHIHYAQVVILLAIGLLVFILDHYDDDLLDALIIAMVAGYTIANHTPYAKQFHEILEKTSTVMYVLFFTLVGASLGLDSFGNTFGISMLFFVIRIMSLMAGAFTGGWLANEPNRHNKMAWYAYVTQAGVALGLAKKVHGQFPEWGADFATLIVAMVVLNQIIGPPLFKHALWVLAEAGRQPPKVRGKVIVLGDKEDVYVRTALSGLGKVGWQCKFVDARKAFNEESKSDSDALKLQKLLTYLDSKLTDEVKVLVIILEEEVAKRVAVHVDGDMPDCRVILQQLPTQEGTVRNRSTSLHGASSGLPPSVIVLDTPEEATEQLLLAAALSKRTLFPSISNALQETRDWERNVGQSAAHLNDFGDEEDLKLEKLPKESDRKID